MKILTININSIRAHIESFMAIIDSREYDVICVQELKCEDSQFPHNFFEMSGYNVRVYGQKTYNGVAIFSKFSIEDVIRGLPTFPTDVNARFMECVIDGHIRLINVYMPNGEHIDSPKYPYKVEWMEKFGEYIDQYRNSEEPVIITGDFNVAITDEDVWNPRAIEGSSITAIPTRKIMQEWLDKGWTDEWQRTNQQASTPNSRFTWYDYRGHDTVGHGHGMRLDYFLTNKTAGQMGKSCYVDIAPRMATKPTDHTGLVLELNRKD